MGGIEAKWEDESDRYAYASSRKCTEGVALGLFVGHARRGTLQCGVERQCPGGCESEDEDRRGRLMMEKKEVWEGKRM